MSAPLPLVPISLARPHAPPVLLPQLRTRRRGAALQASRQTLRMRGSASPAPREPSAMALAAALPVLSASTQTLLSFPHVVSARKAPSPTHQANLPASPALLVPSFSTPSAISVLQVSFSPIGPRALLAFQAPSLCKAPRLVRLAAEASSPTSRELLHALTAAAKGFPTRRARPHWTSAGRQHQRRRSRLCAVAYGTFRSSVSLARACANGEGEHATWGC